MSRYVNVEPGHVTLHPDHWDVIKEYAKNMSYSSTSAALRRIIDEWVAFKSLDNATTPTIASAARELV